MPLMDDCGLLLHFRFYLGTHNLRLIESVVELFAGSPGRELGYADGEDTMPLDGLVEASASSTALANCLERENPQLVLKHAMFEVRPPVTKVAGHLVPDTGRPLLLPVSGSGGSEIKVFVKPITKKE